MTQSRPRPAVPAGVTAVRPPAVLVVEDDDALRLVLSRELRKRGFVVWAAATGGEAVALYRRLAGRVDVLLADVNMPGMTGPQVLAAVGEMDPFARCCFMTADDRPETRAALFAAGGQDVLAKPFGSLTEVCAALRRLIGRPDAVTAGSPAG
ncbi:MAG: response regulator [Gemmataceae bacterium]|nr:response regulator [Gemmataceae bacterium]